MCVELYISQKTLSANNFGIQISTS